MILQGSAVFKTKLEEAPSMPACTLQSLPQRLPGRELSLLLTLHCCKSRGHGHLTPKKGSSLLSPTRETSALWKANRKERQTREEQLQTVLAFIGGKTWSWEPVIRVRCLLTSWGSQRIERGREGGWKVVFFGLMLAIPMDGLAVSRQLRNKRQVTDKHLSWAGLYWVSLGKGSQESRETSYFRPGNQITVHLGTVTVHPREKVLQNVLALANRLWRQHGVVKA